MEKSTRTRLKAFRSLRLPVICVLCNQYHQDEFSVCKYCQKLLIPLTCICTLCAQPIADAKSLICNTCRYIEYPFTNIVTAYSFAEPMRTLLHMFKYHNGLYLSHLLSKLMLHADLSTLTNTECLVPVPLHIQRLKTRGFNQAALLARQLSRYTNIPYRDDLCQKIKDTPAQATLSEVQRQENVKHAFIVNSAPYKHITLIDDLVTTGATISALARAFKEHGVETVSVWCCARTSINI